MRTRRQRVHSERARATPQPWWRACQRAHGGGPASPAPPPAPVDAQPPLTLPPRPRLACRWNMSRRCWATWTAAPRTSTCGSTQRHGSGACEGHGPAGRGQDRRPSLPCSPPFLSPPPPAAKNKTARDPLPPTPVGSNPWAPTFRRPCPTPLAPRLPWDLEASMGQDNNLGGAPGPTYCILACEQWSRWARRGAPAAWRERPGCRSQAAAPRAGLQAGGLTGWRRARPTPPPASHGILRRPRKLHPHPPTSPPAPKPPVLRQRAPTRPRGGPQPASLTTRGPASRLPFKPAVDQQWLPPSAGLE